MSKKTKNKMRKKDLRRMVSSVVREMQAGSGAYHSAAGGRRTLAWAPSNYGPNTAVSSGHERTLSRCRDAARNNEWARSVIDYSASEAVGVGIKPKSLAPTEQQRTEIQKLWNISIDEMDYDGVLDFYGMQDLAYRALCEAGEVFPRIRYMGAGTGLAVPLKIQLLESEMVPHDLNFAATGGTLGAYTIAGIEFSGGINRRRLGYWVYTSHPNELTLIGRESGADKVYIPAAEMMHVYRPDRPGQVRGIPRIATMLSRIHDIQKYDDAMLLRAQVSTLFAGILKRPDKAAGSSINPLTGRPFDADLDDDDTALAPIEAGTMMEVPEGFDVDFTSPPDLGRNYDNFTRYHLMAAASTMGLTYELLSGDLRGISDRALRLLLQKFRRRVEMDQHSLMAFQFCRPVWAAWFDAAMLAGRLSHVIDLKDYIANRSMYTAVKWVPHAWPYFHPEQDIKSAELEIRAGLASRADKVSNRGDDIEQIDRQNAEDNERAKRYGLGYTSSTARDEQENDRFGGGGGRDTEPESDEVPEDNAAEEEEEV